MFSNEFPSRVLCFTSQFRPSSEETAIASSVPQIHKEPELAVVFKREIEIHEHSMLEEAFLVQRLGSSTTLGEKTLSAERQCECRFSWRRKLFHGSFARESLKMGRGTSGFGWLSFISLHPVKREAPLIDSFASTYRDSCSQALVCLRMCS